MLMFVAGCLVRSYKKKDVQNRKRALGLSACTDCLEKALAMALAPAAHCTHRVNRKYEETHNCSVQLEVAKR